MTGFPGVDKPPPNPITPPESVADTLRWARDIYQWMSGFMSWLFTFVVLVNSIRQGKLNATGNLTLTAGVTQTTITDARLTANSFIWLMPTTANAALALSLIYFTSRDNGSVVVNHGNDVATDRTYVYLIIG